MEKVNFEEQDHVKFRNKTGEYIGRVFEMRGSEQAVVEVLAVLNHPTQGDLHHPMEVDVPLFHQRKAMSFREKTVIRTQMLSNYDGEVPGYNESLREALNKKMDKLKAKSDEWSIASLRQLEDLEKDYFE